MNAQNRLPEDIDEEGANGRPTAVRSHRAEPEETSDLRAELLKLREERQNERIEVARLIRHLTEAVAARDAFIATAGNELRNPMGVIVLGVTDILFRARNTVGLPPWVTHRLEALDRQARGFVRRASTLLDVSRLGTGDLEIEAERVCLTDLVADVTRDLQPEAERARCELRVSAEPGVVGWWDRVALEQVAFNLLTNAIRFGAGRPVDISVAADDDFAYLVVGDRGPGISASDRERMLECFERAVVRSARPGFGLGLWIARQLVAAHSGEIFIQSASGVGSVFTARLPRGIHEPQR